MIRCCGWGAGCAVEEALEVGAPRAAIIILVKKEHSAPRAAPLAVSLPPLSSKQSILSLDSPAAAASSDGPPLVAAALMNSCCGDALLRSPPPGCCCAPITAAVRISDHKQPPGYAPRPVQIIL